MTSRAALAATLGFDHSEFDHSEMGDFDRSEMGDYRYKATRMINAIYATDNDYWCASTKIPTDQVGHPWEKHTDQFWAEKAWTTIWRSKMLTS